MPLTVHQPSRHKEARGYSLPSPQTWLAAQGGKAAVRAISAPASFLAQVLKSFATPAMFHHLNNGWSLMDTVVVSQNAPFDQGLVFAHAGVVQEGGWGAIKAKREGGLSRAQLTGPPKSY